MLSACDSRTLSQSPAETLPGTISTEQIWSPPQLLCLSFAVPGCTGQAYTDEGQEPNQSSPEKQSSDAKGPKARLWLFQGSSCQLRAVPIHPVCAAQWRTAGLVPPGRSQFIPWALDRRWWSGEWPQQWAPHADTPGQVSQGTGVPQGLPLTLAAVAGGPHSAGSHQRKEGSEDPGSAVSPVQENLCRCDVCAPRGREDWQGHCCKVVPAHRRGEQRTAERTGMFVRVHKVVWAWALFSSFALSQPPVLSHRDMATEHRCVGRDSVKFPLWGVRRMQFSVKVFIGQSTGSLQFTGAIQCENHWAQAQEGELFAVQLIPVCFSSKPVQVSSAITEKTETTSTAPLTTSSLVPSRLLRHFIHNWFLTEYFLQGIHKCEKRIACDVKIFPAASWQVLCWLLELLARNGSVEL